MLTIAILSSPLFDFSKSFSLDKSSLALEIEDRVFLEIGESELFCSSIIVLDLFIVLKNFIFYNLKLINFLILFNYSLIAVMITSFNLDLFKSLSFDTELLVESLEES